MVVNNRGTRSQARRNPPRSVICQCHFTGGIQAIRLRREVVEVEKEEGFKGEYNTPLPSYGVLLSNEGRNV